MTEITQADRDDYRADVYDAHLAKEDEKRQP